MAMAARRGGIARVVSALLPILLAGAGCSSEEAPAKKDAAIGGPGTPGLDARSERGILTIGVDASRIPTDAQTSSPADVTFPDPPSAACVESASGGCDIPPSACAVSACDASFYCGDSQWVVYYDNGRCVNGACVWDRFYFQCSGGVTSCISGGCQYNGTTIP
jgi:hypothetical protein